MIKKLKKAFPSIQLLDNLDHIPADYKWYITRNNEIVGIHHDDLSTRDNEILTMFLEPHNIHIPLPTSQELWWKKRITGENCSQEKIKPFRFIYFMIKGNKIDASAFREALQNLYTKEVPILWEKENEGIIIESKPVLTEEAIDYEKIIDALMSDLYMNIRFLVGPYFHSLEKVRMYYRSMLESANTTFSYSNQSVTTYKEAILYQIVNQIDNELLSQVEDIVLKNVKADHELLRTIQIYMQSDLNVTVAAKKLHLHRNSLQYRLDKFIDKTGINIKQFKDAAMVYLVILSIMHKEN